MYYSKQLFKRFHILFCFDLPLSKKDISFSQKFCTRQYECLYVLNWLSKNICIMIRSLKLIEYISCGTEAYGVLYCYCNALLALRATRTVVYCFNIESKSENKCLSIILVQKCTEVLRQIWFFNMVVHKNISTQKILASIICSNSMALICAVMLILYCTETRWIHIVNHLICNCCFPYGTKNRPTTHFLETSIS